jgi:hypothetical protein
LALARIGAPAFWDAQIRASDLNTPSTSIARVSCLPITGTFADVNSIAGFDYDVAARHAIHHLS